ncbi:MAG: hypothetical protein ACJARX_001728 [Psychroserpens sp.]|jgi:hypothetical protein
MIVNGDNTVYAMKINDIDALNTKLNKEFETVKGKTTEIEDNKLNAWLSKNTGKVMMMKLYSLKNFRLMVSRYIKLMTKI